MTQYITKDFCDERFKRILEKLENIEGKIDKMVSDKLADIGLAKNTKTKSRDALRVFAYAIIGGAIVAGLNYGLSKL